ncbi:MAG: hypothetical protein KGL59_04640 [Acidobacteriota bacterium]|nr:hypothetical protein [Acidobacteriota bacterium]
MPQPIGKTHIVGDFLGETIFSTVMQLFLMLAAGKQSGDDVEIGRSEQSLRMRTGGLRGFVGLRTRRLGRLDRRGSGELGRFDEKPEMAIAGQRAQMVQTNAC